MKVADITAAILATGYKTRSANFRGIVNQTLIKDKRFVSAGRGLYQLTKKAAAAAAATSAVTATVAASA